MEAVVAVETRGDSRHRAVLARSGRYRWQLCYLPRTGVNTGNNIPTFDSSGVDSGGTDIHNRSSSCSSGISSSRGDIFLATAIVIVAQTVVLVVIVIVVGVVVVMPVDSIVNY